MAISSSTPELSYLWARVSVENSAAPSFNKADDANLKEKPSMKISALLEQDNDGPKPLVSELDNSNGYFSNKPILSSKALILSAKFGTKFGAKSTLSTKKDLQAHKTTTSVSAHTSYAIENKIRSLIAQVGGNQMRSNVQSEATIPPTVNRITSSTPIPSTKEGEKKRAGSPILGGENTAKRFKALQEKLALQKVERLEKEKIAREAEERLKLKMEALKAEVATEASLTKLAQEKINECEEIEKSLC
jgi:hypothetical protein